MKHEDLVSEVKNFDYVGFEIDKDYYNMANKRLDTVKAQMRITDFI